MSGQNLTLALDFCDGLSRWVEQPPDLRIQEEHVDVPALDPPPGLKPVRSYTERYPLDMGLELCLFPLNRDEDGTIHCLSWAPLDDLIQHHGTGRLVAFFQAAGEPVDATTLRERVRVTPSKATVPVKHFRHQIGLLGVFADHGEALERYRQAGPDESIGELAKRSADLAVSRKVNVFRWMEFMVARGTTEMTIEMLRAFRRLADKPELLGRCVAAAEDLAVQLRPPTEAALTLRSYFSGCSSRRSAPGAAFLRDTNRFLTLCQELKTRLEQQRADVEGQMENLIEDNRTYGVYGGSHLALKVMARVRQYKTFDLLWIVNEAEEVVRLRGEPRLPREDWQIVRLSSPTPVQEEMLKQTRIVFAGVCCAVPQGAYVETGLWSAVSRLRSLNRSPGLPELALVVGGHKFVREQIGDPRYYKNLLAPFHEYLPYDRMRYIVA